MSHSRVGVCVLLAFSVASVAIATEWHVPGNFDEIQQAISATYVVDGDTISVWGNGTPPFPPYDAINYLQKGLYIVNSSYLGETPGYPPSWDYVIIDGRNQGTTVTMTSIHSGTTARLEGFTIVNGTGMNYHAAGVHVSGG